MKFRNLVELHRCQAERLGPLPALRQRRQGLFRDLSWSAYREMACAGAAVLVRAGIEPGERVGLVSENRVEWLVADMAILTAGAVGVPAHAPLTAAQIRFQMEDAGVRWLLVSTREQLDKARQFCKHLPDLRGIAVMDRVAADDAMPWDAFLQTGRQAQLDLGPELARREAALTRDHLATIIYTSGTTGNPKGVMLTHGNLLSNSEAVLEQSPYQPGDVVLSWLPLSHIYARTIDHYANMLGGVLVCLSASAETVLPDLEEVQPMRMASVPRFYEKVLTYLGDAGPEKLRKELRRLFGARVEWLSSGGAPLPLPIAERYAAGGILVLQGYGLTETSPVISFNSKDAYKLDTVGKPLPGLAVKIAADGEVLTRGPHVMRGYWNNPQATAEVMQDGWFHTGDLGRIDADGFLSITGRKKELMVLSNGKKVVPSFIEGLLLSDPCIDQAVVYGEGRNFVTALLVPQWDNVREALRGAGVEADGAPERLGADPAVRALLERRVRERLVDVSPAEQVKNFIILSAPFSIASEELTVSLKLRRNVIIARHNRQLDELYRDEQAEKASPRTAF